MQARYNSELIISPHSLSQEVGGKFLITKKKRQNFKIKSLWFWGLKAEDSNWLETVISNKQEPQKQLFLAALNPGVRDTEGFLNSAYNWKTVTHTFPIHDHG